MSKSKTLKRIESIAPSPSIANAAKSILNKQSSVKQRISRIAPSKAAAKAAKSAARRDPASDMLYKQRRPVDAHDGFRRWVDDVHRRLGVKRGRR